MVRSRDSKVRLSHRVLLNNRELSDALAAQDEFVSQLEGDIIVYEEHVGILCVYIINLLQADVCWIADARVLAPASMKIANTLVLKRLLQS